MLSVGAFPHAAKKWKLVRDKGKNTYGWKPDKSPDVYVQTIRITAYNREECRFLFPAI